MEFLPKSNNVPQLKQRPELGTVPGTPPGNQPPVIQPKTPPVQRNVPVLPPASQRTGVPPVPNTSVPIQNPPVKSQVITPPIVNSPIVTPPVITPSTPNVGQSGGRPPQTGNGVPSAVLPTAPRTGGADRGDHLLRGQCDRER